MHKFEWITMTRFLITFVVICVTNARAQPTCQTYGEKDVVCTAGSDDYILKRGLVSDNKKTTGITLKACRITDLEYEVFKNDDNLQYIDLAENRIARLKLGVLDENKLVTFLNLSHNLLSTFPLGLFDQKPNLEVLDLKGNKLNLLEKGLFEPFNKLKHLDLSSNALLGRNLDSQLFANCHDIKFIDFSRNDMSDTPEDLLRPLVNIDFLNLDRCSLKEVPGFVTRAHLKTMKHLMLSTNQISKVTEPNTFINLDNLEIVNLSENIIEEIGNDVFKTMKKLKMVVLRNNRLKVLSETLFLNVNTLANLDLSYNLIEYVPVNAFRGSALKNLNLSHNRFSYLDANFCLELRNTRVLLNKFYFNDNPWQCACLNDVLKEVKFYNIKYNGNKYNGEFGVCVTNKFFTCTRQKSDNVYFVDMYDKKE